MTTPQDRGRLARESLEAIDRAMSTAHYTHAEAREAHCWFDLDRVPNDPATTAWKRLARWRQARWRDGRDYPIGSDPLRGGPRATQVGSRMELGFAQKAGANFLTPQALAAVRARLALREEHQQLDADALWADLLGASALGFNLFGPLAADPVAALRAVRALWPDFPATSAGVRFEHSPGRLDRSFLGDPGAFDAAFELEGPLGGAIIGIMCRYHEHAAQVPPPPADLLARFIAVTERSDRFRPGWDKALIATGLQSIWQGHLRVLSMLQHASQHWQQGRFVLVYPALNPSFAAAAARYAEQLTGGDTFEAITIEALLRTAGVVDRVTRDALQARYV
jgi:hypothetical protein